MHPRCRHIGETYLNVDFSSSAQVVLYKKLFFIFWFFISIKNGFLGKKNGFLSVFIVFLSIFSILLFKFMTDSQL